MTKSTQPLRPVTDAERRAFAENGVVHLPGIYPPHWVERLAMELDDVFAQHDARHAQANGVFSGDSQRGASADLVVGLGRDMAEHPDTKFAVEGDRSVPLKGRSIVETAASHWHDGMRRHNVQGPLGHIVHEATGSTRVVFYCDQLFLKEPGSRVKTPFHQDKPYFLVDGGDVAVAWVPVDVVDRDNGAMRYVRGSHLWGRTFKPSDFRTETGTFPEVGGISLDGLDTLDPSQLRDEDIVYFDAQPGDVIIHHWATLHGSTGNVSATRTRRAASVRFALDGCRFHRRPSSPEPFRFTVHLAEGAPLESDPRFEVVWPRSD